MQREVCGFCFSQDRTRVALIRKKRPKWQAGKLNGIGGQVEREDESNSTAMAREFAEETGSQRLGWRHFFTLSRYDGDVYFFTVVDPYDLATLETRTDESIEIVNVRDLWNLDVVPNLCWLVPLALDENMRDTRGWIKEVDDEFEEW